MLVFRSLDCFTHFTNAQMHSMSQTLSKLSVQCAGSACLQALHVLQTCLYCEAVSAMSTMHQLRDQVLALVFQLSWAAKRTIKLADSYVRLSSSHGASNDSSDESSDAEAEPEAADSVAAIDESTHGPVCCGLDPCLAYHVMIQAYAMRTCYAYTMCCLPVMSELPQMDICTATSSKDHGTGNPRLALHVIPVCLSSWAPQTPACNCPHFCNFNWHLQLCSECEHLARVQKLCPQGVSQELCMFCQVAQAALQVWARGSGAAGVLADSSVQERVNLDAALKDVLLPHLNKMSAEAFQVRLLSCQH